MIGFEMEQDYETFNKNDINTLGNLNYNFVINDRYVHVKDDDNNYFSCQTPFLKILKPVHITLNKKKTIANKYVILEISDDLDFNNQIGEFMFMINKIHEVSQVKIKENSLEWFNTEFDDIGLDIKVKRPIDQQKESEFIKIAIPKDKEMEEEFNNLKKNEYIMCNIIFKGLKISNEFIMEEWEIKEFITQTRYEDIQRIEMIDESAIEKLTTSLIIEDVDVGSVEVELVEENILNNITNNEILFEEKKEDEILELQLEDKPKEIVKKSKKSIKDNKNSKKKTNKNKNIFLEKPIKKSSKKIIFT